MRNSLLLACLLLTVGLEDDAHGMSWVPCYGFTGEVPLDSSFVMGEELAKLIVIGGDGPSGTPPQYEIERIDQDYVRLKVRAAHGKSFQLAAPGRCKTGTLTPNANWKSPTTKMFVPRLALGESGNHIEISWDQEGKLGDIRVDWAFSPAELHRRQYSTAITSTWNRTSFDELAIAEGSLREEIVFLRVTRYSSDGSEQVWNGWAYKTEHGRLKTGRGGLPMPEQRRFRAKHPCDSEPPRLVPARPNFYGDYGFVEAVDGTPLRTKRLKDGTTEVGAPVGTVFRFGDLPRITCPDLYKVDTERTAQLEVASASLGEYEGDPNDYTLDLDLESPQAWPTIEVRWSEERGRLESQAAILKSPHQVSFTNMHWSEVIKIPDGVTTFYVQLTPVWSNERRGAPLIGRVSMRIDADARAASFDKMTNTSSP